MMFLHMIQKGPSMDLGVEWDLCVLFVQTAVKCQDMYTKIKEIEFFVLEFRLYPYVLIYGHFPNFVHNFGYV